MQPVGKKLGDCLLRSMLVASTLVRPITFADHTNWVLYHCDGIQDLEIDEYTAYVY